MFYQYPAASVNSMSQVFVDNLSEFLHFKITVDRIILEIEPFIFLPMYLNLNAFCKSIPNSI